MAVNSNKFFYPPAPGTGLGTFDNIVGLQVVDGGGLTTSVFDFTSAVTEKVNRTFSIGTFSNPISLEDLDLDSLNESRRIQQTQFRVYPNFDVSQDDFTAIVKNMASELFTVTSIKAAAEGLLEMAWDDDKQDFVFRKGESKNGDSNEERKEQGS